MAAVRVFHLVALGTLTAVRVFYLVVSGPLSAVGVFHSIALPTLSTVTIFAQIAEVLCRLSEYFHSCSKSYVGRESSSSCRGSILSAVTMFLQKEEVLCRPSECRPHELKGYRIKGVHPKKCKIVKFFFVLAKKGVGAPLAQEIIVRIFCNLRKNWYLCAKNSGRLLYRWHSTQSLLHSFSRLFSCSTGLCISRGGGRTCCCSWRVMCSTVGVIGASWG